MNAQSWIALLRHIPAEKQPLFTLITSNGTEMTVQSFLRIEAEFVVVKGRLAASQDAGRVFFIPYESIDSFSFTNPVRDSEFEELFGNFAFAALAAAEPPPAKPSQMSPPAPESRPAIRSEVLERFRSRAGGASAMNLPRPNVDP